MPKQVAKQTRIVPSITKIPVARNIAQLFNNATNLESAKKSKLQEAGNLKDLSVYTSTPRSSKSYDSQPIRPLVLMSPIAEKRTTTFSNIHINLNFNTVGLGLVQSAIGEPAAAPMCPFVFSGSDQSSHSCSSDQSSHSRGSDQSSVSPVKGKMSNHPPPFGRCKLTKLTSKNDRGKQSPFYQMSILRTLNGFRFVISLKKHKTSHEKNISQLIAFRFSISIGSIAETVGKSVQGLERHQQMFKSRYAKKNRCNDGYVGGVRFNRRFDLLMKYREDKMDAERVAMQFGVYVNCSRRFYCLFWRMLNSTDRFFMFNWVIQRNFIFLLFLFCCSNFYLIKCVECSDTLLRLHETLYFVRIYEERALQKANTKKENLEFCY